MMYREKKGLLKQILDPQLWCVVRCRSKTIGYIEGKMNSIIYTKIGLNVSFVIKK